MCRICGDTGRIMKQDRDGEFEVDCPNGCCPICSNGSQHGIAACPKRSRPPTA